MINEPFAIGNSVIHRIDPRIKIVFAALYSMLVAIAYQFQALFIAMMISILLIVLARLQIKIILKRLLILFGFLLVIWVFLPFTFEGEPLWEIGPFVFNHQGVLFAAQISLKSISILLAFIALVTTMAFTTLGYSLDRMGISRKIVFLLMMTYRYIFVIEQEYQRLLRAVKIRGFRPGTKVHTYKTYAYIIGMLFVRASFRAERVSQAMRCRGFKGRFYCLHEFSSHSRNWIFGILMSLSLTCLVLLEWVYKI